MTAYHPKPALLDRIGASHCVIEASAGTGKTYTLEHLVVQLILEGVPLESILVVTFTRKAALELTVRVRAKITELLAPGGLAAPEGACWALGPGQAGLLRNAFTGFDRATISTIHGFCKLVLDDAAFEGGHLFHQECVAFEDAFEGAFTAVLRAKYGSQDPALLREALEGLGLKGFKDLLRSALRESACLALEGASGLQARAVAAFLPPLEEELRRRKREEGLFDFDDMIRLVQEALDGPQGASLARRLRERYRVALIDEFQDTDSRQWTIFRRVFLDSGEGHRLFVVGDPKQAIYGFRGGDLPTYVEALEDISAATGAEPLQLDRNFRSTQALIDAYNAIFQGSEDAPFFSPANARHYKVAVACGKPDLAFTDLSGRPLEPIQVVDVPVHGSARLANLRAAAGLARAVEATLAQGRFGGAALRPEHVHVLVSKAREGRLIAQALKARGIPAAFYREDGLFDGPEAEACRDVLLAIESPFDEGRRAKALLGPFFGMDFQEAERARDLPEGHPVLARLFAWRELAQRGKWGELFSRLASESGLTQRLLFLDGSHRALTNLLHILELLQRHALSGHRTLLDLAIQAQRWIDGQDRPASEDAGTQRLERREGAVQILTMHKSKGLQAPVVALFGGTSGSRRDHVHRYHLDGRRKVWVGPLKEAPGAVREAVEREEAEEGERLAYVALTRGEARLILPRYVPGPARPGPNFSEDGSPKAGPYRAINRRLLALLGPPEAPLARAGMERIQAPEALPEPRRAPGAPPALEEPRPLDLPGFEDLRRKGRPVWSFSFTSLQKARERARAEGGAPEEAEEADPAPPASAAGRGGGRKLGTRVHAFLQQVDPASFQGRDLETWSGLPAIAALADALLPREHRREALRWIHAALSRPLPLPGGGAAALCDAPDLLRELDFLTPYPGREDFLEGSLDVLFRAGGRAYLLDWKTNRLPGYGPEDLEEAVASHYELQVRIYAVAVRRFLGLEDEPAWEREFGGVLYVFLRGLPEAGIWSRRPSWSDVLAWERELEALRPEGWIPASAGGESHE